MEMIHSSWPWHRSDAAALAGYANMMMMMQVNLAKAAFFLFQRLSVLIQRLNAVLLHDCFVDKVAGHSS